MVELTVEFIREYHMYIAGGFAAAAATMTIIGLFKHLDEVEDDEY